MKIVRVHNPSGLRTTKRKVKTMARRRRRSTTKRRRRTTRAVAVNPRRRRRHTRRRRIVARAINPARRTRRRRHARRRNPSAIHVGQIFKNIVYGTGGAIATRTLASLASGFVPGAFAGNQLTGPLLQIALAATVVRWGGKKFLGQQQGDALMFGGFISAGLALADQYLPNVQNQLSGIFSHPVSVAPGVAPAGLSGYGAYGDVEEVHGFAGGLGDVEDVMVNEFGSY